MIPEDALEQREDGSAVITNESLEAAAQGSKTGDTVREATVEEVFGGAEPGQEGLDQNQKQLALNGLVEWSVGVFQQTQQQLNQVLGELIDLNTPEARAVSHFNARLDEAKMWLISMYDEEVTSPPTEPESDIWTPEGAGSVGVPELHVVGDPSRPVQPADATEGGEAS